MAISKNWTFKEIPITGAYLRIGQLHHDKVDGVERLTITVEVKASRDATVLDTIGHVISPYVAEPGIECHEQAYTYLKALPAYAGATDC